MNRLVVALSAWSVLTVIWLILIPTVFLRGCHESPLLLEYDNHNLVCPNGGIVSPASTFYQGTVLWWVVGVLIILAVASVVRYRRVGRGR